MCDECFPDSQGSHPAISFLFLTKVNDLSDLPRKEATGPAGWHIILLSQVSLVAVHTSTLKRMTGKTTTHINGGQITVSAASEKRQRKMTARSNVVAAVTGITGVAAETLFTVHSRQSAMGLFPKATCHVVTRAHRAMTVGAAVLLRVGCINVTGATFIVRRASRLCVMAAKRFIVNKRRRNAGSGERALPGGQCLMTNLAIFGEVRRPDQSCVLVTGRTLIHGRQLEGFPGLRAVDYRLMAGRTVNRRAIPGLYMATVIKGNDVPIGRVLGRAGAWRGRSMGRN